MEEEAAAIVAKEAADAANKAAVEKAALEKIRKEEEQAKEKTRRAQQKIDDQIYAKKLAEEKAALKREMELYIYIMILGLGKRPRIGNVKKSVKKRRSWLR